MNESLEFNFGSQNFFFCCELKIGTKIKNPSEVVLASHSCKLKELHTDDFGFRGCGQLWVRQGMLTLILKGEISNTADLLQSLVLILRKCLLAEMQLILSK